MGLRLALGGDAILTRRINASGNPGVQAVLDLFRKSDLGIVNFEMLMHNFNEPGVHPAAEAGWTYMRAPKYVAQELADINIRLVGTANNHFMDYSYGGLYSTHAALAAAGLEFAGSGETLADARAPAFFETPTHRISLVSMTTSATKAARAAPPHDGIRGRPGVNPLGWHYSADAETMREAIAVATKFGWWISRVSEREWQINPPGLHHSMLRYFLRDEPGAGMILDEDDEAGNLRAIGTARHNSDLVVVHIHSHEWDQEAGATTAPAGFLPPFVRRCIDAGADIVLSQGSHAPLRGIEIYKGKPIFYDPGDLFAMSSLVTRFPAEFYTRHDVQRRGPLEHALPSDGLQSRQKYFRDYMINPVGGYQNGRGRLGIVPILHLDGRKTTRIELHPFEHEHGSVADFGMPVMARDGKAQHILDHVADLSRPFGTSLRIEAGRAEVVLL